MIPPKEFLRKIKPFSFLTDNRLSVLISGLDVAMYRKDSVIYPKGEVPEHVFLVFSGLVGLYDNGDPIDYVSKGEIFGLLSAISGSPSFYAAKAIEDSVCYLFSREAFAQIYQNDAVFASFFTSFIERRFRFFSRLAREEDGTEESTFTVEVGTLIARKPVTCTPGATVEDAVWLMDRQKVGSVVVISEDDRPVGILTTKDLRRAFLHGDKSAPVQRFMSSPVISLNRTAPLIEAYTTLLNTGIDHLVVVQDGRMFGVVTSKDILSQLEPSSSILALYRKVIKAGDLEALRAAFTAIKMAVAGMALKGFHFYQLSRMLTSVYDMVVIKVIEYALESTGGRDFAWLHMGSSGRREQVIAADQDNALAYRMEAPPLELAASINEMLDQVGIPKCPANYMASNAKWFRSLADWKDYFSGWFLEPTPDHLRYLTVFLDIRSVFGDASICQELLRHVYDAVTNQAIRFLAYDATLMEPPIGIFGIKHLDRGINLKKFGIYPIANGVRVLALDKRLLHITNTRERIDALRQMKALGEDTSANLLEAYAFLQDLRLRHQARTADARIPDDNLIGVQELDKMDLLVLKESLKIVSSFQRMLKSRYGVERGL